MPSLVASLFGVLSLDDSGFTKGLDNAEKKSKGFGQRLQDMGQSVTMVGASMTALTAPFIAGMGYAVSAATDFGESMANIQAAAGYTDAEMMGLNATMGMLGQQYGPQTAAASFTDFSFQVGAASGAMWDFSDAANVGTQSTMGIIDQVFALGEASRYGPGEAAKSFYEIAGGVDNASARMSTYEAAIHAAQAGNAGLTGTTNALIAVMNGYKFSADKATFASDVLTRIVGKGKGSMDEFAGAIPNVAGLAADLGIGFDDLGAQMAYMTTKGVSASEASTMLKAMMTSMLSPTADMEKAIKKLGYTSGRAMVESEGLEGAYKKLAEYNGGNLDGLVTNVEALTGAGILGQDAFTGFFNDFIDGVDGATKKAEDIQMKSAAAQFDLLKSSVEGLAIKVGDALLPVLQDITKTVTPIIGSITDWVKKNPKLVQQVGTAIAVVAGLGVALTAVGIALGVVGGAFAALTSPIGIAIGLGAALVAAYTTNFGGFADFVNSTISPVIDVLVSGVQGFMNVWNSFVDGESSGGAIEQVFMSVLGFVESIGKALGFIDLDNFTWGNDLREAFFSVSSFVEGTLLPALGNLAAWFVSDGLPAIGNVVNGIWTGVIQPFFTFLGNVWAVVGPALGNIASWFISDGLPGIVGAAEEVKAGVETVFNWFAGVWEETIKPGIQPIVDWFTSGEAWQTITTAATDVKDAVSEVFTWFSTIWEETIRPGLDPIVEWFTSGEAWQTITTAVTDVKDAVSEVFTWFSTVWAELIQPNLQLFVDWFVNGEEWQSIVGAVEDVKAGVEEAFTWFSTVWEEVILPGLKPIVDWFTGEGGLQTVTGAASGVKDAVSKVFTWFSTVWEETIQPGIQPIVDWFTSGTGWQQITGAVETVRDTINTVINGIVTKIGEFISTVKSVWGAISGAVNAIAGGIQSVLGGVQDIIDGIAGAFNSLVEAVTGSTVTVTAGGTLNVDGAQAYLSGTTPGNAWGGPVAAGQPTYVGEQGKEIFVPESNGTIIPNGQAEGMMGGVQIGTVVIQANDAAGGRAAAEGFDTRLKELRAARG